MIIAKFKLEINKLIKLQQRLEKNLYKRAVRAGAKLAVADIRGLVPVVSGTLKKSISVKVDSPKGQTQAYAVIGPRSDYTKTVNGVLKKPSRYAHFVDHGKFHTTPFIAPAMAMSQKYLNAIQSVIKAEIEGATNG